MVIDSASVLFEMGKFHLNDFEKGKVLIGLFDRNIEVIEKTAKNKNLLKNNAYKIDAFAKTIGTILCNEKETQKLKPEELQERQGKYFALLKHVFSRRNEPGLFTRFLTAIHVLNPLTPSKQAEQEITSLLKDKDYVSFNKIKRSYIEEKIKLRQDSLQKAINKKEAIPAEHFENSFLESIHETLKTQPNISFSLFIHEGCFDALSRFSLAIPPSLATSDFAKILWKNFLEAQQKNQALTFDDFLKEKQEILEEKSFKKLASLLNKKESNPLEQEYLSSKLSARLQGKLSHDELKKVKDTVEETLNAFINDVKTQAPQLIQGVKDEIKDLAGLEKFHDLYIEDFEKIDKIIKDIQALRLYLISQPNKRAVERHDKPMAEYDTLQKELIKTVEHLQKSYAVSLDESFKRCIEENGEISRDEYFTRLMLPSTRKVMQQFAKALPPLLATSEFAQSFWYVYLNEYKETGKSLDEFLLEKQIILKEPTFKSLAKELQEGPIDRRKQGYLQLVQERLEGTIKDDETLKRQKEDFEDSPALLAMEEVPFPELKDSITEKLPVFRDKLSGLGTPIFYVNKKVNFKEIEALLSTLEDMQIYLWPKEHPEKTAEGQYLDPQKYYELIKKDISEKLQTLENAKEKFDEANKGAVESRKKDFLEVLSKLSPGPRAIMERVKNNWNILLHPGFKEMCAALDLKEDTPINRAVQNKVVYWISEYLRVKDKENLFKYIPENAGAVLEKYREDLTEYEATLKKTQNTISSYIKELEEILKTKGEVLSRAPKIKKKDPRIYAEEFLKALKKNYDQLGKIKEYDINKIEEEDFNLPFALISGMEKKMNDIRKASGKP
jgi:hypothetical protein